MKNFPCIISLFALTISCTAFYYSFRGNDLVYIDVNKVIEGYNRTKIENAEFEKKALALKAQVDTLVLTWQQSLKNYEKERASLTEKEAGLRQQILAGRQQEINEYQERLQKEVLTEEKKMKQTVINDINEYLKEFGKNGSYHIIFGAGGDGNIMYADESTDLTDKVLEGLNERYEK